MNSVRISISFFLFGSVYIVRLGFSVMNYDHWWYFLFCFVSFPVSASNKGSWEWHATEAFGWYGNRKAFGTLYLVLQRRMCGLTLLIVSCICYWWTSMFHIVGKGGKLLNLMFLGPPILCILLVKKVLGVMYNYNL